LIAWLDHAKLRKFMHNWICRLLEEKRRIGEKESVVWENKSDSSEPVALGEINRY